MDSQRPLTVAEVARLAWLSPDVVRRQIGLGRLPARRCGRDWRVHPKHLAAWQRGLCVLRRQPAARPAPVEQETEQPAGSDHPKGPAAIERSKPSAD